MPLLVSRREFLAGMGAMGAATVVVSPSCYALAESASSFRVSIINDEISQDFGHACEVASREFGMRWIELRTMWNKNIVNLDSKEVAETQRILKKYSLRVTDIASPLFKVDWKGAPRSRYSEAVDFHASFTFDQQDEVLGRGIEMAKGSSPPSISAHIRYPNCQSLRQGRPCCAPAGKARGLYRARAWCQPDGPSVSAPLQLQCRREHLGKAIAAGKR